LEQAAAIVADAAIPVINTKIALANNVETQADDCVLQNTYHSDKAIYRNPEIFKNTSLTEEVEKVFTAYESNNCYDYLASTLNVKLTDEMIKTLSKSRTHNKVSDDKINLMTDFTLIRTGNFSIVYFEKLLTTVVSKNFSSKNEMLE
jgi:replication initiation and membrane attachment protein DnaB